jgi:mannose/fructose/N-acetylgalactosamine-specific phosphotransferase system component IIC
MVRRMIALAVFAIMFALFGLFLRHIVQDHAPAGSSQDSTDSSSE